MTTDKNTRTISLVEKYAKMMFRCAYNYCHNKEDAEDILQEVFLKYLKKSPEFENESHEKAWFLRVTINTSKDYINTFWYRKTEDINESILYEILEETDIWDVVRELAPKYRIIIHLYYQEGYSIKEISTILKLRESTVGTQLSRARDKLKKLIKED